MAHVSDIKLIRTDTTLDLSQKAEKGMISSLFSFSFIYTTRLAYIVSLADVGLWKRIKWLVTCKKNQEPAVFLTCKLHK
ncbi:hypothetical protein NC652_009977 [Populus alba x Populus x berolinensis]|nr:hypothetical protein NC652_009977 [Populus alba x Populus x berolinensis]